MLIACPDQKSSCWVTGGILRKLVKALTKNRWGWSSRGKNACYYTMAAWLSNLCYGFSASLDIFRL